MAKSPASNSPPWNRLDPKTATGKLALEVLRTVVGDDWAKLPPAVQQRAEQASVEYDIDNTVHQRSKQAYKLECIHWIDSISRTVMTGERPESLLTNFMSDLNKMMTEEKSDALFALLLEEIEDGSGKKGFQLMRSIGLGVHKNHWQGFKQELRDLGRSQFLQDSLQTKNDLEVHLARYIHHYNGELDSLVRKSKSRARQDSANTMPILDRFWISRIALSAEQAPPRCLIIAYENTGNEIRPQPAQGAADEWRVLFFLRIAYSQLNFRIRDLPRYVSAQRNLWIRELAPSVLAHEAAAQTNIISDSAIQATESLLTLLERTPALQADLGHAAILLDNVLDSATNLNRTFSTYLNLQRKSRVERFPLGQVYGEAWELCRQRLYGIEVAIDRITADLSLQTDRSLLTLVLTNLLANGTRAINEGKWPDGMTKHTSKILLLAEEQDDKLVQLILANSGPPILPEQTGRIFEQGFSSYADGHGQGLFVSRLICQHLGGNLLLASDPKLYGEEFNVAFAITLNPNLEDFSGEQT
jgi:signal transduction histidine kinase